jgi:zinc protease
MLLRLSILLALLAAAPLSAQTPDLRVPYVKDTLENGLTIIVHEDRSAPVVTVNVWYHVGSGDELPGRTGFAHLFEHLMFMGSEHAPYPEFDTRLEAAGARNNGSTTTDRTNYYEWGPSSALPLMLWLEADRMGWLLPTMDAAKVDLQRDVVKNERRQRVDNQPYGLAGETLLGMLYPAGHPYSWPVIGSMTDLSAATLDDTRSFFRTWYAPNNAAIVVAGDVRAADVFRMARELFSAIPRGPAITRQQAAPIVLERDTVAVLEDRVQLPRLHWAWHSPAKSDPRSAAVDIAAYILGGGKTSRLVKALQFDRQLAASAFVRQDARRQGSTVYLAATARPGVTLAQLQDVVRAEIATLAADGPTDRELEQAKNGIEAAFLRNLETVEDKADRLNAYFYETGEPDGFAAELARYRAVTADDVKAAMQLLLAPKAVLSIVPQGKRELAAPAAEVVP